MNNENNILSEINNIHNEINVIRKMFSEEELSAFNNFVNSQHPQISEPESLSEKCYLLSTQVNYIDDFKVTNTRTWAIEIAKKINLKDIFLSFMPKAQEFFEGDIDRRSAIASMVDTVKESPVIYDTFLLSNGLTDDGFQMLINRMLSLESKEERIAYAYKHEDLFKQLILEYGLLSFNKETEDLCFNRDEELASLYVLKESYKQFPNLFSKAEPFCRNIEKLCKYCVFLYYIPKSEYDCILYDLFTLVRSYIVIYSNDWRKYWFDEQFGLMGESQRFSFVNFLNLSVEGGGSPYAEAFCDAMEQYCYENSIEPAIPLNLVNRRTAKLVRNGSGGEYVRVLNRKLKGVNEDPAKEDRILYDILKKLHYKLIEDGILDKTADEELFIFRLSGLNKPGKLSNNLKVKNSIKLGLVLRCLCSDRNNPFPRTKLGSFFITDAGNKPNFSSNTIVTQMEMKRPTPKTNFHYVVTLLEEIGFCNVRDVHNGARS
ncbi:MAG: hypothetical protein ACI30S_06695 [Muribaculaceae bacterium]